MTLRVTELDMEDEAEDEDDDGGSIMLSNIIESVTELAKAVINLFLLFPDFERHVLYKETLVFFLEFFGATLEDLIAPAILSGVEQFSSPLVESFADWFDAFWAYRTKTFVQAKWFAASERLVEGMRPPIVHLVV